MGSISRIRIMSRYPSAYGHTPGYKSMTASTPTFPSALDRGMDLSLSSGLGGRTSSSLMETSLSSLHTDPLMRHSSALSPLGSSCSDSTYKSTRTGASGIPHTSYSHTTSSFDSYRPHRNNVSSFSYNI